jgi:predicted outer membrane repeat protein
LVYWSLTVHAFFDHLLTGVGINRLQPLLLSRSTAAESGGALASATDFSTNAASTYLQLIAEGGVCALVWFLTLFRGVFIDVRRALSRNPVLGAGLAGAVLAILICWITDIVVLSEEPVAACFGVLMGMVAGAAASPSVPVQRGGVRPIA